MRHSKSRLVEDADESAPVRLENRTYRGAKVSIYFSHSPQVLLQNLYGIPLNRIPKSS